MINRVLEAMGGREAIDKLESLSVVADCTGPNGAFVTAVFSLRPDKVVFQQYAPRGTTELIVIGKQAWLRDPETGATQPMSEANVYLGRGHEFHMWLLELDKRYYDHQLVGEEMMDDTLCHKLIMWAEDESLVTLWVDAETHLPHQWQYALPAAFGGDMLRYVLTDWRSVGDLTLFYACTLYQGGVIFTYKYRSIERNNVDASLFHIRG